MKSLGLTLKWFVENAGAQKTGRGVSEAENAKVGGVSTDSRTLKKGDIFVAIEGEKFDGHSHAAEAVKKGALAVVAHKALRGEAGRLAVTVGDTVTALGDLARALRRRQKLAVIGLTGSNGKTTTKELLSSIMRLDDPNLLATTGNLNNHIGLPLTIFKAEKKTRRAILEMGANHFGEIAYLTAIAEPQVALITSVGSAHLEFFKTINQVARAKGELFAGLAPEEAVAVVDADSPLLMKQAQRFGGNKIFFGTGQGAQVRLGRVRPRGLAGQELVLYGPGAEKGRRIDLKLLGPHNARNALAAAAAALAAGAGWDIIQEGLSSARNFPGRLSPLKSPRGFQVLDDSYNANPDSVAAGLRVLAQSGLKGPKGAILGDMGELGTKSRAFHAALGQLAAELKLDFLALVGPLSRAAAKAALKNGLAPSAVAVFDDPRDAADWVAETRPSKSTVLIKGSRFMHLEKAVDRLMNTDGGDVD